MFFSKRGWVKILFLKRYKFIDLDNNILLDNIKYRYSWAELCLFVCLFVLFCFVWELKLFCCCCCCWWWWWCRRRRRLRRRWLVIMSEQVLLFLSCLSFSSCKNSLFVSSASSSSSSSFVSSSSSSSFCVRRHSLRMDVAL